jgi:hypothetical protein
MRIPSLMRASAPIVVTALLATAGCLATPPILPLGPATARPVGTGVSHPFPTGTPRPMTFPTLKAVASASGVAPQILMATGVHETMDAAGHMRLPPSVFSTATADLRPTPSPDYSDRPHQWTDAGVIFPGWLEDLGMVCYKMIEPPAGLLINSFWMQWDKPDRDRVFVYAGATAGSAARNRGSVMVAYQWDPCTWEEYMTPDSTGTVDISDARRHTLQLRSPIKTYYFDIDARSFVSSFPEPTQTASWN